MTIKDGICEVCGRPSNNLFVVSSMTGPMSHASCQECVENNAEPTSNLVYLMYVSNNNIENLHPSYKDIMFYNTIKEQYDRFGDNADRFKADLEYIP